MVKKVINTIYVIMAWFGVLTVLAMILIVSFNVFNRLLFRRTIGWGEEISLILMVWFSMIGLALGVKTNLHIAIELFTMRLPEKIKKHVINRISALCTTILGIVLFYYGIMLVQNGKTSTLPATQLPTSLEYIFVPITGFLITIDSVMKLITGDRGDGLGFNFHGGEKNA